MMTHHQEHLKVDNRKVGTITALVVEHMQVECMKWITAFAASMCL